MERLFSAWNPEEVDGVMEHFVVLDTNLLAGWSQDS